MTAPTWTPAQALVQPDDLRRWFGNNVDRVERAAKLNALAVERAAAHWPQPQPITGEQLGAALLAEGLNASAGTMAGTINALDRAAARLSPQPMAVDVEAVAREIVRCVWGGASNSPDVQQVAAILSRHLTAAPPPSAPVVVPVAADTMDEMFALLQAYSVVGAIAQDDADPREAMDARMSAFDTMRFLDAIIQRSKRLPDHTARAADVLPCRVVRRRVEAVDTLVVPEDGRYARRGLGIPDYTIVHLTKGEELSDRITAIRRIDTDAPTTWIERQTTPTPRPWEAGDVPPVGSAVVLYGSDGKVFDDYGETLIGNDPPDTIADAWNRLKITAYAILPDEVPHAPGGEA